jgi:hypothetical protein
MAKHKLQLVSSPPLRAFVHEPESKDLPVIQSSGPDDLLCGECETVLADGITEGQIPNALIRCPYCNAVSNTNPPYTEVVSDTRAGDQL